MAIKSAAAQVVLVIPEETPEFYANFLQVFITEWDFLLVLGSTHLGTDEQNKLAPTAKADVLVRMSPQHAKATLATLSELVGRYESEHGPINSSKEGTDGRNSAKPQTNRAQRRRNPV